MSKHMQANSGGHPDSYTTENKVLFWEQSGRSLTRNIRLQQEQRLRLVLTHRTFTAWTWPRSVTCTFKRSEVRYNERMLQRTVFINKIRMLQRTQTLQRTRRNTIGRRSTRVRMTCRAFPLWLERQSSSLLSFVRFSHQFSSVSCLFV